jgi:2-hydroxychromene-2-carboxylate isomerase
MSDPIRFYFDFASPYAYFSVDAVERIAAEHRRTIEWRPILVWAILKAQGIAPPMESPTKRAYFLRDMARSADYYAVPYREPIRLPVGTHLAARLFHVIAADDPTKARAFGRDIFSAFFVERQDISIDSVVISVAGRHDLDEAFVREAMTGPRGRALLEEKVAQAIADGVCGSPWFVADGEGFFGADRLPQLHWRLSSQGQAAREGAIA